MEPIGDVAMTEQSQAQRDGITIRWKQAYQEYRSDALDYLRDLKAAPPLVAKLHLQIAYATDTPSNDGLDELRATWRDLSRVIRGTEEQRAALEVFDRVLAME